MKRERLIPVALATGVLFAASACTTDGPDSTSGPPDTDSTEEPTTTSATTSATTAVPTSTVPNTEPSTSGTTNSTDTSDSAGTPGPQGFGSSRLGFFDDCPALLDYMQTAAADRITAWGLGGGEIYATDEVLQEATTDQAPAEFDGEGTAPFTAPFTAAGTEGEFSGTNTQEAGVDEGDIVETDGEYVYVANDNGVRIVSVADAEVVAQTELPNGSQQMLLDGDRLLVVTASWTGSSDTIVSLFDVSDPTSPTLLRRSHLEGSVVATRSVDGVARLVVSSSFDQRLPFVQPNQFGLDEKSALERNQEIIEQSTVNDWLPRWFEEVDDASFGPMEPILACADVAAPSDFAGLGLTWIASMDIQGDGTPVGSAGIVSNGDTVYASAENLYISTQNWEWRFGPPVVLEDADDDSTQPAPDPGPPPTQIHQFRLDQGTEATYVASGEVEGRLLNQFSMSEFNGDLRVATTTDDWGGFGDQSESTVSVLRPNGGELEQISSVSGLGRGEQIYAVRFFDDVGYVVTFRQIDPLYVIDLSDPENPVLDGELKIPGYSAYLHPVGDGLLLGVGQDADDDGRALGTQLSLFDVNDPANPERISTLTIGGRSDVEWDHKAFLYWQPDGTIVLPVSPGWESDCPADTTCLAKELAAPGGVLIAELNGRELAARGAISPDRTRNGDVDYGCWNPLQRSIAIGDELVTVGLDQMIFSDRADLSTRASVTWGDPEQYGCYWYFEE